MSCPICPGGVMLTLENLRSNFAWNRTMMMIVDYDVLWRPWHAFLEVGRFAVRGWLNASRIEAYTHHTNLSLIQMMRRLPYLRSGLCLIPPPRIAMGR